MDILNIERCQKKPRKDIAKWEDVLDNIWYMYDNKYNSINKEYEWGNIKTHTEIKEILDMYMKDYFDISNKDNWFEGIKNLTDKLGYASNMKEYKENPSKFKGNVADISTVLRVALTTKAMTPDLYEIMRILGRDRIIERYNNLNF